MAGEASKGHSTQHGVGHCQPLLVGQWEVSKGLKAKKNPTYVSTGAFCLVRVPTKNRQAWRGWIWRGTGDIKNLILKGGYSSVVEPVLSMREVPPGSIPSTSI